MTKAAVKAMDTVEDFLSKGVPGTGYQAKVSKWGVAGASKRGWTTWLVAAVVPDRVHAAIPIVLDMLNFNKNIRHMYRNYGGWSWALKDYEDMNYTAHLDDPNNALLSTIIDGYFYRERLTMPKLVINTGMDEFFMPDDTHWWWNDMPSPKHFLMMPNTEHSCATGILEMLPAVGAWLKTHFDGRSAPEFDWKIDTNGTGNITVDVGNTAPHAVAMWHATTCNGDRRDFRALSLDSPCTCGVPVKGHCLNLKALWYKTVLTEEPERPGIFIASQPTPKVGWTAFFIDVTYGEKKPNMV